MSQHYGTIAFTRDVAAAQERHGSRQVYAAAEAPWAGEQVADRLTTRESAYLAERDSFYVASVGSTGWPYVQYRGGPPGFLRVVDDTTLGWADFVGNLQYVSTGNIAGDDRVALIVVDYARQRRLKVYGHARVREAQDVPELAASLSDSSYPGEVERVVTVTVAAYDWNCPRHIVQRLTAREIEPRVSSLVDELTALRKENARLRGRLGEGEGRTDPPCDGYCK